ncbi:MAG: hypothetical protein E6G94_05255 [Alphaproteobacteria bacterium]|nr:MAG: hypothetical protein E6G94_05255 [Alphaproteobacteria bacterium]
MHRTAPAPSKTEAAPAPPSAALPAAPPPPATQAPASPPPPGPQPPPNPAPPAAPASVPCPFSRSHPPRIPRQATEQFKT